MQSKEFELYVDSTIKLARSITIKSQQTIEAVNQYQQSIGIDVKTIAFENYKYLVNLRGEYWSTSMYAPSFSHITLSDDLPMVVRDLDNNNVEIPLTVDDLPNHPLTHSELRSFGRFYKELVAKYPDQVPLIRRIIDPITIDPLVLQEKPDGEILFYDTRLVASNEVTLISSLQSWIFNYISRWQILAFGNSDVLFPSAQLGIFRLAMVNAIMDFRLERLKTAEVCDFHLWSYLGGYFGLDRYRKELKIEQALFLYRNIEYIVANAGTKNTMLFIYNNMIKDYGLTLNTFELRQDSSQLATDLINTIIVNKFPIDADSLTEQLGTRTSLVDLIDKIKYQGVLNKQYADEDVIKTREAMLRNTSANIATGIIECEKEHVPYRGLISHTDETFNIWFWLAGKDIFNYQFPIQIEGTDGIYLTAKEAALLLLWCRDRLINFDNYVDKAIEFDDIMPTSIFIPNVIDGENIPPYSSMSELISQGFYDSIDGTATGSPLTTSIFNPSTLNITSVEDMMELVVKSEQWKMRATLGLQQFQSSDEKAGAELAVREFMTTAVGLSKEVCGAVVDLRPSGLTLWSEFIDSLDVEFNVVLMGKEGILNIMDALIEHFVGNIKIQEGITSPHFEMMQIMRLLSSYLVTYVAGDSSGLARPLKWNGLSGHTVSMAAYYRYYLPMPVTGVDFSFVEV